MSETYSWIQFGVTERAEVGASLVYSDTGEIKAVITPVDFPCPGYEVRAYPIKYDDEISMFHTFEAALEMVNRQNDLKSREVE